MHIYRPKKGPVFTLGRLQHFLIGASVPLVVGVAARAFGGTLYEGATIGAILVSVMGGAWEMATARIASARGWKHPWGDVVDFLAFQVGAWTVAFPVGLLGAAGG